MKRYLLSVCGLLLFVCLFGCKKKAHPLPSVPAPSWTVTQMAQYTVTMTAVVQVPEALLSHIQKEDELAVFIDGECRGTGTLVQQGDVSAFFVLIHGTAAEKGKMAFKYYSSLKSHLYSTDAFLPFVADGNYGTADVPMVLDLEPVK